MNAVPGISHSTHAYYQTSAASTQPHETDDRVTAFQQHLDQPSSLAASEPQATSSDHATKTSDTGAGAAKKEGTEKPAVTQADVTKSFNDLLANQTNHLLAAHKQQMQDIYDELEHPPKSNKQR